MVFEWINLDLALLQTLLWKKFKSLGSIALRLLLTKKKKKDQDLQDGFELFVVHFCSFLCFGCIIALKFRLICVVM